MSPIPNWSSTRMKMPDRKSRTSDCEPKPSATPRMPAPAISGPSSTPSSPRIMIEATSRIVALIIDRRTLDSASIRCSARTLICAGLEQGVGRRAADVAQPLLQAARLQSPQSALHGTPREAVDEEGDDDDENDRQRPSEEKIRCFCWCLVSDQVGRGDGDLMGKHRP